MNDVPSAAELERFVAFEGFVRLMKWQDTSTSGPKVWFALGDRVDLDHFEKATKRRGKKAGQRYMLTVATDLGDPLENAPTECWFAGAQWSHQSEPSITLVFESVDFWRRYGTADHDSVGQAFHFTMVQLQENEQPVDQEQADLVEQGQKRLKGGPRSKNVALLTQGRDFQSFVGYRMGTPRDRWYLVGADSADRWIKQVCGVQSKIEFDHNEEAWERYEKLIRTPFLTWARANLKGSYE